MFKKVLAVALAATMVLGMASVASADTLTADLMPYLNTAEGCSNAIYFYNDEGVDGISGLCTDNAAILPSTITSVTYSISATDAAEAADPANWYGGKVGVNSKNQGWKDIAVWTTATDDANNIIVDATSGSFTVTFDTTGLFVDGEDYCQVWLQTYGKGIEITGVTCTYEGAGATETGAVAPVAVVAVVAVVAAAVVVSSKKRA